MTHDELLAIISVNQTFLESKEQFILAKGMSALRAVVELLKDYSDGQVRVNEEFNQGILALSNVIKEAIEKELK